MNIIKIKGLKLIQVGIEGYHNHYYRVDHGGTISWLEGKPTKWKIITQSPFHEQLEQAYLTLPEEAVNREENLSADRDDFTINPEDFDQFRDVPLRDAYRADIDGVLSAITGQEITDATQIQATVWIRNNNDWRPRPRQHVLATILNHDHTRTVKECIFVPHYSTEWVDEENVWKTLDGAHYSDASVLAWMPKPKAFAG